MDRTPRLRSNGPLWSWIRDRVRLVGSAALGGGVLAVLGVVVLLLVTPSGLAVVSTQAFSLGALCFGFGLLGWSGSVLAGSSVENAQRYLDTGTNWSEDDSRRAMARIGGFGFGGMVGVIAVSSILWV
ncbi:DUF7268 family protein [Halocatena pleomorpha]|uniref:Uncharacterized protein n=1 Tax=Halocatena pleomorpha TaxID=1785090 RepID=A0A3P3R622_9EURY|nr:hypothetical protein [Halocatena pleomorpha]RRJ28906.1 hypothetical protein EIK79_14425 [Halocatena pleomorpha]